MAKLTPHELTQIYHAIDTAIEGMWEILEHNPQTEAQPSPEIIRTMWAAMFAYAEALILRRHDPP